VRESLSIIGAGRMGRVLAGLAVAADIDVIVSNSRGPSSLADLVAELGDGARAATPAQAAAAATEMVVLAIPLRSCAELDPVALAGKIVVDTTNYYPERDGRIAELDRGELTTSELVQRGLPCSRVVKAFNNIAWTSLAHLGRPVGADDRSALPVAGDDPDAKDRVGWLVNEFGYDVVDIGPLWQSWRTEPGTAVYVSPYMAAPRGSTPAQVREWVEANTGVPAPRHLVQQLVDGADRVLGGGSRAAYTDR
jgi:predicted dinucleotide-binding enzyme